MAASQLIQFPLRAGQDEKTDPKSAPPGTLTELVNMRQLKTGQFVRRYGHTALTQSIQGGGSIAACKRLAARKEELLLSDGSTLYGYSPNATQWISRGQVPTCVAMHEMVKQMDQPWTDVQYAYSAGLEVFACVVTIAGVAGIIAFVREVATGVVVSQPFQLSAIVTQNYQPSVVIVGNYAVVLWTDAGGALRATNINLTNLAAGWAAPVGLVTDVDNTMTSIDAVTVSSTALVVVYMQKTGSTIPRALNVTASTLVVNAGQIVGAPGGFVQAPCLDFDPVGPGGAGGGPRCYLTWSTAGPPPKDWVSSFDPTALTFFVSPQVVALPTGISSGSSVTVVAPNDIRMLFSHVIRGTDPTTYWTTNSTLGAFTSQGQFFWSTLKTKPFIVGSSLYVTLAYASTYFIVELLKRGTANANPLRPTATLVPRTAWASSQGAIPLDITTGTGLPRVYSAGNNHYRLPGTQISDANARSRQGILVHDVCFGDDWIGNGARYPAQRCQPVEFGELLHLQGGTPSSYDGERVAEMSFLFGPQLSDFGTPATSNTGGSLGQGTYQYIVTYEWTDDAGQVYRSQPSDPVSVTTTGVGLVNKVTLTIPCLWLTNKTNYAGAGVPSPTTSVQVIVYRTLVNGDGTLFYRATSYTVPAGNLSIPYQASLTIVDTASDASISASSTATLLYTNGGTQPNQCPPSLLSLIKHRRRLAGIGDDGRTVWFSTEYVDREAPEWGDYLQIQFDERLTAIASLDDKFLGMSQDSIWYITGDGPNQLGQGSDWISPQKVQTDTGCIDPRSIITTSNGILFRGRKGFYMIDRGLNVTYVGGAVEDTLLSNPLDVCALSQARGETSCFLATVPDAGELAAISTGIGVRLHWDSFRGTWAKDFLTDASQTSRAVAGLTPWNATTVWATPQGQCYQQVQSQWLDGSSWYDSRLVTAFVAQDGPLGFQRVRRVGINGSYLTPHDVKLSLAFDDGQTWVQSYQWKASNVASRAPYGDYVTMRVGSQAGANPRCNSVRAKLEILAPTDLSVGTGQAASLSALAFEIVPKTGIRRTGQNARV